MQEIVRIVKCNTLTYDFFCSEIVSNSERCFFFTPHNLSFSWREQSQIGEIATNIVKSSLEFRDIRQIFVTSNRLTVVFKKAASIETLPEQIARIIEKAFGELGAEE